MQPTTLDVNTLLSPGTPIPGYMCALGSPGKQCLLPSAQNYTLVDIVYGVLPLVSSYRNTVSDDFRRVVSAGISTDEGVISVNRDELGVDNISTTDARELGTCAFDTLLRPVILGVGDLVEFSTAKLGYIPATNGSLLEFLDTSTTAVATLDSSYAVAIPVGGEFDAYVANGAVGLERLPRDAVSIRKICDMSPLSPGTVLYFAHKWLLSFRHYVTNSVLNGKAVYDAVLKVRDVCDFRSVVDQMIPSHTMSLRHGMVALHSYVANMGPWNTGGPMRTVVTPNHGIADYVTSRVERRPGTSPLRGSVIGIMHRLYGGSGVLFAFPSIGIDDVERTVRLSMARHHRVFYETVVDTRMVMEFVLHMTPTGVVSSMYDLIRTVRRGDMSDVFAETGMDIDSETDDPGGSDSDDDGVFDVSGKRKRGQRKRTRIASTTARSSFGYARSMQHRVSDAEVLAWVLLRQQLVAVFATLSDIEGRIKAQRLQPQPVVVDESISAFRAHIQHESAGINPSLTLGVAAMSVVGTSRAELDRAGGVVYDHVCGEKLSSVCSTLDEFDAYIGATDAPGEMVRLETELCGDTVQRDHTQVVFAGSQGSDSNRCDIRDDGNVNA